MLNTNNPDANFSLLHGFRFRFTVEGKELLYLVSAWTGKEFILYDGEEISSIRSYKKKTSHNFLINDVVYKATLTMDSLLKGGWHCCLFKSDRMVKCFDLHFEDASFQKELWYGIAFGFLLALTPKYLWFVCIPLICVAILRLIMRSLVCKVRLSN